MAVKEGDRVRVASREANEEDIKSGLYYNYFAGLTGSVLKVYSNNEVSVDVEHESLTKEIRKRHDDVRDQMKTKWLDGLSEEGRGKLTEREKDFNLRYVLLVAMKDVEKIGARKLQDASPPVAVKAQPAEVEAPVRRTLAEIEAAEAAELARRASAGS